MNSKKIALQGARMIDGTGKGPIESSLILIDGKTIVYAGENTQEVEVDGYEVMDVSGKTIMPGMVEAHIHFAGTTNPDPAEWIGESNVYEAMVSTQQAKKILQHGFTSARDISRNSLELKKAINEGIIQGPRIYACGRGLCRTGGHGDWPNFSAELIEEQHPWAIVADGKEELRKNVRKLLRSGADGIKIWASGGGLYSTDREMNQHYIAEEIAVVVEEASYFGVRVIAHCESLESAKTALLAGVTSIEHGEEIDDECIELMKKNNAFFVPTLMVFVNWFTKFDPPYREILENFPGETLGEKELNRIFSNFRKVKDAGVKMAVGPDSFCNAFTPYGPDSLKEVYAFVDAGCSEMEAIVAATKWGAELLEFDKITGTLEAGKMADLIVLKANPLDDIKNLTKENMLLILKEGEAVE